MSWQGPVRVASVPANHVYVRHLAGLDGGDGVNRLPDPPSHGGQVASQWWPPAMLDPLWIADHLDDFDVFHIHFGFDAQTPATLSALVAELRAAGKPLVYTAHDLRNPHHRDPGPHRDQLDVLIPAADTVVTLTAGAAETIERRWGRRPLVLPHPHVVDIPKLGQRRRRTDGRFVIGVHAKSLRASMDPLGVLHVLTETILRLVGCELRVDVHTDVMSPGHGNYDAQLAGFLRSAASRGRLSLFVHNYFSDEQLWDYLSSLDVSVLPYRFGTHSGWLEACHDLGTTVIAPTCGFYAQQRPCVSYGRDENGMDVASLAAAVEFAYQQRPTWQAKVADRLHERQKLAQAHRDIYSDLLENPSRDRALR
jgi:hypothetical protein